MPHQQIYKKPPIIEAIIELSFDGVWEETAHKALIARLVALYTGNGKIAERGNRAGEITRAQFLTSADEHEVVGVGIETMLLALHSLAPYQGWSSLVNRVSAALDFYVSAMRPLGLTRVAVRYLDRIVLPLENGEVELSEFLTCLPQTPRAFAPLNAFHLAMQGQENDGTMTMMTVGSVEPDDEELGQSVPMIYDLNVERSFPAIGIDTWIEVASKLHELQRSIFEESITDATRRLFQ